MSKVIRISDSTIEVLENIRKHIVDNSPDIITRKIFIESNEDDLIRSILETFLELHLEKSEGR